MLIFPSIKEYPIKGLTGLGGGATGLLQTGLGPIVYSDYLTVDSVFSVAKTNAFDGNSTTAAEGSSTGQISWDCSSFPLTGVVGIRVGGSVAFPVSVVWYVGSGGSRSPATVNVTTAQTLVTSTVVNMTGFDSWRMHTPNVYEVTLDGVALVDP